MHQSTSPPVGRPAGRRPAHSSDPALTRRRSTARTRWGALACALTVASTAGSVVLASPASAAVPVFPDNIVVFPNRDMVSLEGFEAASGKQVTIEVRRGGSVIGAATGTGASPAAIAAGEPTVEVNHPGGICWGAGGGPQVTPNIQAGDVIVVRYDNVSYDTTVQDVEVTGSQLDGGRLVVSGRAGAGVDTAKMEQRIINPSLKDDPAVARRDVRAVPPAELQQSAKGDYQSGLAVTGGQFTATYQFPTAATATAVSEGQLRVMAWQNEDADGNRQGLTISEFGEIDGPGFGGCPAGAAGQGPKSPTGVTATQSAPGEITVGWTPATQNPGTAPVQGFTVRAVSVASTAGEQTEFGKRISNPNATSTKLSGTLAGNRIEVRTVTDAGESWPPALVGSPADGGAGGNTDTTAPTVSATPAGGTVTADPTITLATSADGQIYYTLDGTSPLDGVDAGADANLYTAPFPLGLSAAKPSVTLKYVAFDAAGNTSFVKTETYTLGTAAAPGAPVLGAVTPGNNSAVVNWTAPTPGSQPITGYTVTATPPTGPARTATALPGSTQATVTGLTNGTVYTVTVTATNAVGTGAPSAAKTVTPAAPAADTITVTRAQWKTGDFRIQGTGSEAGATITVTALTAQGVPVVDPATGLPRTITTTVAAPVAPEVTGAWTIRARTGWFATNRPALVRVTSSRGGSIATTTVANG
ncbi:hypothetical protein DQ239_12390 [Blastococcus sp. TF02-09]|uniref:fibronectin type III domain-containing protein n=1 Tax=Blastococcus sp. TF02-09 TaxID=2250576 RepID=UPI000DEA1CD0|nr:fibronectin type III domain-containing protein [Blastococcus sp. TF02-9]RBY76972.1 hypothetical protein DQ239_12390 [Blastococcus sp. TF02-9]